MEPTSPADGTTSIDQSPVEALWRGLHSPIIPGLDGIRALAVMGVLFFHLGFESAPGGQSVLAFFVLSGFLITWLLLRESKKFGRIDLWRFYARRSLRIFPAFYGYLLISLISLIVMGKSVLWPQFIAATVYLTNYFHAVHGHQTSLISHTWSLSVEEQFYLLWPITLVMLLRSPDRLASRISWGIGLIASWRIIGRFWLGLPEVHAYETLDMRGDHLLVGCLLAVMLDQKRGVALLHSLTAKAWGPWITIALLVVSDRLQTQGVDWRDSVGFFVDPWLVAVLIVQWIAWSHHPMWSWLNSRLMGWIGRLSYSIYLFHPLAFGIAEKFTAERPVIRVIGCCLSVLATASLSYWCIEKPFLSLKSRFHPGGGGPSPPPSPANKTAN